MKKLNLWISAVFVLLASVACSHESDLDQVRQDESQKSGINFELSGVLEPQFGADFSDTETFKALDVYQKGTEHDAPLSFSIDIEKYKDVKMHLFLRKVGGQAITTVFAPVKLAKSSDGGYTMTIQVKNLTAQGGESFATGEWYVAGFWGGGSQEEQALVEKDRLAHKVAVVAPISPNHIGDAVSMDIPLGFSWTRLTRVSDNGALRLENRNLKIRPMGVLLSVILENRTKYTADIVALDKEMTGMSSGGRFDFTGVTDNDLRQGEFPAFRPAVTDNTNNESVKVLPAKLQIPSGAKTDKPLYLWLMPTASSQSRSQGPMDVTFTFISSERTTTDSDLDPRDQFSQNGVGHFNDRYVMDLSFKKRPENSVYFIKKLKVQSSLMITEYFINRYDVKSPTGKLHYLRHPLFFGFVELYNPNLDPVSLENYALARISNLRRYMADGRLGKNYSFMHPFGRERYNAWESGGFNGDPKGRADRNADNLTWSHRALLISLQLQDGQISSFQPNSLGFKSSLENNGNGIVKELYPDPANDNRRERVRFLKGGLTSGKAMLSGGKTMLLLGNAFLESGDPSDIPSYWYQDSWGNRGYYTPEYKLATADWNRIKNSDECEIIVALDNYTDKNEYTHSKGAGVMNLNYSDALFLVQKHSKDGSRRRIVDATSSNPFARVNNWTDFVRYVTLTTDDPNNSGAPHFRVRTVAQHMPEFLNFSYQQWYAEKFTGTIPSKASPGHRSAKDF